MKSLIVDEISKTAEIIHRMLEDIDLHDRVLNACALCVNALKNGRKILIAGNGGSAADAQHIAAELVVRMLKNRKAIAAIALTTDSSIITATSNDFDYNQIFSRQIEALGKEGDVFIALSTSGNSPNILEAIKIAKENGLKCVAFTSIKDINMHKICDESILINAKETHKIQEAHLILYHILCIMIENSF